MRYFDIRDPFYFKHRVGVDSAGVHGMESIGHHLGLLVNGRQAEKLRLVRMLVAAIVRNEPPPPGFNIEEIVL